MPRRGFGKKLKANTLTLENIIQIVIQLCDALRSAHTKGIYHRDLKPANIIIDEFNNIKLVDFGIAKISGNDISRTNQVIGTFSYMAPEQFSAGQVDQRTDIWSIGILLYEALTGARPFNGENPAAIMYQLFHGEIPQLAKDSLPATEKFNHIFKRTLNMDKQVRYQSTELLANELRTVHHYLEKKQQLTTIPNYHNIPKIVNVIDGSDIEESRKMVALGISIA